MFFSLTSGQHRKTTWFLFVSVQYDCFGARCCGIQVVQVYCAIISDGIGCHKMVLLLAMKGSVAWQQQLLSVACGLRAPVAAPNIATLSLGVDNSTEHSCFET